MDPSGKPWGGLDRAAIALGLCSIKQESKAFNNCVDEVIAEGKTTAAAVRFCNGGAI